MRDVVVSQCPEHGAHEGEVCMKCYAHIQERVERESVALRYANTTQALRGKVLAMLSGSNGHSH